MKGFVLVAVVFSILKVADSQPIENHAGDTFHESKILEKEVSSMDVSDSKMRQRRNAEYCPCHKVDFNVSWDEISFLKDIQTMGSRSFNIGACLGAPVVFVDNRKPHPSDYQSILLETLQKRFSIPEDVKRSVAAGFPLMQFHRNMYPNRDSRLALSFRFLPSCIATLKAGAIIYYDEDGSIVYGNLPNLIIDSCTCA